MSARENIVQLFLPTELLLLIRKDASDKEQLSGRFILSLLLEHYKDRLTKEVYEQLNETYSMTEPESKEIRRQKELEKAEKRKQREKRLEEREARRQAKIKHLLEQKGFWQNNFKATHSENAERRIKEMNEKLSLLGYEEFDNPNL